MICLRVFIVFLSLASTIPAFSQELRGKIVDEATQEPLIGAHVMLKEYWRVGTVTNVDGSFSLDLPDSLAGVNLNVIFSFVGYEEKVVPVRNLNPADTIALSARKEAMEEITIVADRLISEDYSVRKIDRMDVYQNPSAKGDALLAVNALPSSTTLDESANVSFRGAGPGQTGIFFNGVPIYDAVRFSQLNGIGTFSLFNTEIINSIHIFAGNPPLEFGNVSGGLIAIESQDQIPRVSSSSLLISMASMGLNHTTPIGAHSALTVYSNYQLSGPLKWMNSEALEDIHNFGSIDAGVHFVTKNDNGSTFKLFNYSLRERYNVGFKSPTYNGSFEQGKFRNFTVANALLPIGESSVLTINSGYSYSDLDFSFSASDYDILTQNIYTSVNWHREKKRSSLKVGLAYDGEYLSFDGVVPQVSYALRPSDPHMAVEASNSRNLLEPYGYYKYAPSRIISFGYALRSNIPIGGLDSYLSYQSNIKYDPKNPHAFRLSRGKMHQYITDQETTDYQLIASRQTSLDHEYEQGKWLGTHAVFFNRNERGDLNTRILGLESSWRYRFTGQSFLELSYTGLDVKESRNEISSPGRYDIDYFVRLAGQYEFSTNWTVGLRGLFRQGQYYQPVISADYDGSVDAFEPLRSRDFRRLPGYNILDVNISKLVPVHEKMVMVFFASASNALDFKNVSGYTHNFDYSRQTEQRFSQRTFYFGFYINFQ